ncbi:MAG: WS/DGAT/MGAT family O-acyltransferase [Blastococcus sp.]
MDRMNPLDAAFLQAEDEEPGVSLAIASIAVFEGPAPTTGQFTTALAGRLPLIPRYRQKAREVPLDLGPPVWVDDPAFDINYHVRRTALPAPGGDAELAALMGRVMSARLDRGRPRWEYWVIEGLAQDRWAMISKVHHCMVDGISGTDLYHVVLDESPQPRGSVPDDWHPRPEPSSVELAVTAALDLLRLPLDQVWALAGAARHPTTLAHEVGGAVRGMVSLAGALVPAAPSSLSGPLTTQRRFAFARSTVEDVGTVRRALGGTFNDVVMAAVTAGFRALLLSRGEEPTRRAVRSLVPVSVRPPGTENVRDNEVSLLIAELPVEIADPVERLAAVREHLGTLKARHEAEAGASVVAFAGHEPFPAVAPPVRISFHLRQRSLTTVTTNVPGPREPLYAFGRRLLEIIPYVPIASTVRTGVSIFSYCGQVTFGVTGDAQGPSDVWTLARGIDDGMTDLLAAARSLASADAH